MTEQMLSMAEVQEFLGLSASTLARLVREGRIPAYKIRGSYRFFASEVQDYVRSQRVAPKLAEAAPRAKGEKGKKPEKITVYVPGMRVV